MATTHAEREDKYDVDAGFGMPDWTTALPDGGRVEHESYQLVTDYFDTSRSDLARAGVALRRRSGGPDAGWHLKIGKGPIRHEVQVSDLGTSPPEELTALLTGIRRRRPLLRIAELRVERSAHQLFDATGTLLAEVDDDTVHACASPDDGAVLSTWREVEIELGSGDEALLERLGNRLVKAGASPSVHTSKLHRALGGGASGARRAERELSSATDVVGAYIGAQRRVILAGDLALRQDGDVIHPTRVATRRLRSTLRTFGTYFDPARAEALDSELRWWAGVLGEVRDRQVLRPRLDALVDALPATAVLGPVRSQLDATLRGEEQAAWKRLKTALNGRRYLALLDAIDAWTAAPPVLTGVIEDPAHVAKRVRRARRKVATRLESALESTDDEHLHRARKAAKRARYAAELAEPVLGAEKSAKLALRYRQLQDLLGEHQDSVVSAEALRRYGARFGVMRGQNGFTYGLLYEREQELARRSTQAARQGVARYL